MKTQEYTIKASSELMRLLSSGLYQHKTLAVVRELASNAIDAVKENGGKVLLKLYGNENKGYWFQVSDTGPGLTVEETIALMSTYGNSTKMNNDKVNGKFGVGSKAPFAYSEEFYISASKNGEKHYFKCYKDDSGMPYIQHLKSKFSNQTGLDFRIKIKKEDVTDFFLDAMFFTALQNKEENIVFIVDLEIEISYLPYHTPWDPNHKKNKTFKVYHEVKPMLNSELFYNTRSRFEYNSIESKLIKTIIKQYAKNYPDAQTSDMERKLLYNIYKHKRWSYIFHPDNYLRIRVGNMEYYIEDIKDFNFKFKQDIYTNRVFVAEPKEISLTGSRESVELSRSNIKTIQKKLDEFTKVIENLIESDKSLIDRLAMSDLKAYQLIDLLKNNASQEEFHIDFTKNKDLLTYPQDKLFGIMVRFRNNKLDHVTLKIPEEMNTQEDTTRTILRHFNVEKKNTLETYELHIPNDSNTKFVFCMFSRKKVDTLKMMEKYGKDAQLYFTNNDNLETILKIKKLVTELQKIKWISDKTEVLDIGDVDKFKRTHTKKISTVIENQKHKVYKLFEDGVEEQDQYDPEAKTLFYFIHRRELYLAKYIGQDYKFDMEYVKYTQWVNVGEYMDPKNYFTHSNIAKILSEYGYHQAVVFNTKKEMLKFFKTNNINIDLVKDINNFYDELFKKFPGIMLICKLTSSRNVIYRSLHYSRSDYENKLMKIFDPIKEKDMLLALQKYKEFFIDITYKSCNYLIPEHEMRNIEIDKNNKLVKSLTLWAFYQENFDKDIDFKKLWNLYELITGNIGADINKEIIEKINIFEGVNFDL